MIIAEDPWHTLRQAQIGPGWPEPDDADYGRHIDQADLAERYGVEWGNQVRKIADERGLNITMVVWPGTSQSTQTMIVDSQGNPTGRTEEDEIWQAAHDEILVYEENGRWIVKDRNAEPKWIEETLF